MSRKVLIDDDAAQYANLQDRLKRVESALARTIYKQALSFNTGWANFGGAYETATCSRIDRLVVLQGLVAKTGGAPAAGDLIATLPVDFRPSAYHIFTVSTGQAVGFGTVELRPNGELRWGSGLIVEPDYTSLSGIVFVVD
jgi:hypothetical protein